MKTFKQFQEEARQLDEALPLLAAVPAALKIGGAALTAYSGLSALNNLRKGKFKQAAFDAIGAIPGGRAFKLAKGLGATKNLARGASALQSANRFNLTGLTPNAYAKGVDKTFDVATKGVQKGVSALTGSKKNKTGANGKDLILKVPIGTQIYEEDNNTIIYDFKKNKEKYLVATGGKGGLGNVRFKSSTNRAPRKFTKGISGEQFTIWLQLKTIADIGIVGLPNAGKSSLLAALTNANPKIANYQFTTLNPNLGVATYDNKEITIADIPGLVEGAHKGTGLGTQFLKHIERCKSLLHMIDITNSDLNKCYKQIRDEMKNYNSKLSKKKELIVLNKTDLIDKKDVKKIIEKFSKKTNSEVITLSTFEKKSISKIKSKLISYAS